MGLHFLGIIRIGLLYRQFRADAGGTSNVSFVGAFVIGLAFAFGWTPCVGPVLAAILFTAAGQETAGQGAWLLFVYGLRDDPAFRHRRALHRPLHALDGSAFVATWA